MYTFFGVISNIMGKSKKRTINKITGKNFSVLKRAEVIRQIILDIHNNNINDDTIKYVGLFGITIEELSEAGADYEELSIVKSFII